MESLSINFLAAVLLRYDSRMGFGYQSLVYGDDESDGYLPNLVPLFWRELGGAKPLLGNRGFILAASVWLPSIRETLPQWRGVFRVPNGGPGGLRLHREITWLSGGASAAARATL